MTGPATRLIHAGETDRGIAVPLTTPIYETTTFVFDNAEEVAAYNSGQSSKYLYSRYTNPKRSSRRSIARNRRSCSRQARGRRRPS